MYVLMSTNHAWRNTVVDCIGSVFLLNQSSVSHRVTLASPIKCLPKKLYFSNNV